MKKIKIKPIKRTDEFYTSFMKPFLGVEEVEVLGVTSTSLKVRLINQDGLGVFNIPFSQIKEEEFNYIQEVVKLNKEKIILDEDDKIENRGTIIKTFDYLGGKKIYLMEVVLNDEKVKRIFNEKAIK